MIYIIMIMIIIIIIFMNYSKPLEIILNHVKKLELL